MFKSVTFLVILSLLFSISGELLADNATSIIKSFDDNLYSPQKSGLSDLVFEMRISGLTEELNKKSIYGKINDVYFKFFWMAEDKIDIEVHGISGFEELKSELKRMALTRLDNVLPIPLTERLKDYELKATTDKSGLISVKAADKSYTKVMSEIDLTFDRAGRLLKMRVQQPTGQEFSEFKMSPKSWSKGKQVLDHVSVVGLQSVRSETTIGYQVIEGLGFPQTIKTITHQTLFDRDSSDKLERKVETEVIFSSYEVNAGKAKQYFGVFNKIK